MIMKKVLLTNFRIKEYTGSEIDTITIANYFLKNNYDVDIFTLEKGEPLLKCVDSKINVIDFSETSKLNREYSLIWSHHWPLLDYIIFNQKIRAEHICYISLSTFEPIETLPVYYKNLTENLVLSNKSLEKLKDTDYDMSVIKLFSNYATKDFFDCFKGERKRTLKKICIVSNHVPEELKECSEILKTKGYKVNIYGNGYEKALINSNLLKKFDLVITIGKTVEYALAAGIPVYCYDHFGGDLYITSENIERSFYDNFSGRSFAKKKSGIELFNDIINNYSYSLKNIVSNRNFAIKFLYFENNMEQILNEIKDKKLIDFKILYKYYIDSHHSESFVKYIYHRSLYINNLMSELSKIANSYSKQVNQVLAEKENLECQLKISKKELESLILKLNDANLKIDYLSSINNQLQNKITHIEKSVLWKLFTILRNTYNKLLKNV